VIQLIPSAEDVIALKVSGRPSRDGLMQIVDRIETSLEKREKTHIYVEVEDFTGFDLTALGEYLPRAFRMLGKLERFGRIAVVSDLRWVRWATKLESALLPHISYETFETAERARALAWVEGKLNPLHDRAIRIIETDKADVIGFEIDGRVGAADAEAVATYFNEALSRERPLRLLGRITKIEGGDLGPLLGHKFLQMKIGLLERVERYAVVGGPIWLCAWIQALDPLVSMELRHFPADREADAWAWLGARPKDERAEAA
jgi:hypothetical protein